MGLLHRSVFVPDVVQLCTMPNPLDDELLLTVTGGLPCVVATSLRP